jgi:predicted DNA-binding transcriptional regulator YafY
MSTCGPASLMTGHTGCTRGPPPDRDGLREVMLTFEEERVAAHRLAGFGGEVAVTSPETVQKELIAAARELLARYGQLSWPSRSAG